MRTLFTSLLALAISAGALAADIPPHAVVFLYHRFGDTQHPSTNITLEQFDAQLDYLAAHDFTVWPLQRVVAALHDGTPIPDHTVALSVDDAYESVYRNAWPRLRARGWPFTVFVSTDAVDAGLPDFMTWDQMREMQQGGASFANHGASHGHLVFREPGETDLAWADRVRADIGKARRRLDAELGEGSGEAPQLFAYPYGEYSEPLARLVRGLGYVAFGQESGALGAGSDLQALPRYPMAAQYAALDQFVVKADSLPLPVQKVGPWGPLIGAGQNPPLMTVVLDEGGYQRQQLACYAGGQRLEVTWLAQDPPAFSVRAASALPVGRSRYNCTAPDISGRRYYWFSHPWLLGAGGGE